ncbi:MAG: xanthine dehydrogenase family protein molybdopterin-binding subunit [Gammaproteobacteria bacterium]|nr:xanthine dehydrogenase family protein molybdopterin-binding subunit [Gammaproteobacteria bacterium]MCP5426102.1 xanthine dehydrogenase family protein molybdopterin-binding subunit [Gammaproteobacteria bacterium]
MNAIANAGRRTFLKTGVALGAGLTLGFYLPTGIMRRAVGNESTSSFAPNAFLRIAPDNTITVLIKHLEMGQGVYTGLPMLVAEELEADWQQIKVESAPADAKLYGNLAWGGSAQGTGGSTSLANSWEQLRLAGATAREMLIAAAAAQWSVDASSLRAEQGYVIDSDNHRKASFGELAAQASTLSPPQDVTLKPPKDWKVIGKSLPRKDSQAKSTGKAQFAIDIRLPSMLTALVARPPRFGASVKSFDATQAEAVPGVKTVVQIPQGVAVVAENFWAAKKGRDALKVEWDGGETVSTEDLRRHYIELADSPGLPAANVGDAEQALASAENKLEAIFEFPYLAHASMEPLCCVVDWQDQHCDIWAGSQLQTLDQAIAASILGLKPEQVNIHTLFAGGSFGRHANPTADYIAEGAAVAKATRSLKAPIRLLWTREDDIQGGYYRPQYVHHLVGALDGDGKPLLWRQRIVGQSILSGTPFESMMVKEGIDMTSVEGASNLAYAIPNLRVELRSPKSGVPVLWWRSVGHTHTGFATEVFIDELATAARQDPVAYRRELLSQRPRHQGVLELAAAKAGWGTPLPKGRGRGIAVHESFNSFVAEVAEVTVQADGSFTVDRVVCAVDCGYAINPDVIKAQMEGGIGFGLAAALSGRITLKDGVVQQSNFHDYPVLRINQMPSIEVYIVPSEANPTGVGEPGVPPIAPAVANALFAATGKRIRRLPIDPNDLKV